jgi:hypothetical protein
MRIRNGLTTWNVSLGGVGFIWRWNMPVREAIRTWSLRRFSGHGFAAVGPLILEW